MEHGAFSHLILAFSVGGALAVPSLAGCGSGSGTSSTNAGGAVADASDEGVATVNDGAMAPDDTSETNVVAGGDAGPNDDSGVPGSGPGSGPDGGVAIGAPVTFSIDMSKGPTRQFQAPARPVPVSPYIYGINGLGTFVQQKTRWGLIRKGGNTYSDWNWTNNYLNAGSTQCFWQGHAGGGAALAGAITHDTDGIPAAQAVGEAYLATVPIGEHVAAAFDNDTAANNLCPVTAPDCYGGIGPSTGVNTNSLDFVSTNAGSAAFVPNAASKPGAFCTCAPSEPCGGAQCGVSTNPVYQDEFVNYIKTNYGSGGAPVFFELDNEPNYWGAVHPELWPFTGTLPCQTFSVTDDDILSRDEQFAAAVKKAWPATKVFGPTVSQDGIVYAHSYDKDAHWPVEFLDYYLGEMAKASASAGMALLDVLDVHYYNNRSGDPSQCVQNPRMFWDPNYTAASVMTTDQVDFAYSGIDGYFDTAWYPRRLIPRLFDKIAIAYPAGGPQAPALAFSEYNSGCEDTIAGAIAEADDLGVFGREGVFAATVLPVMPVANNYLVAAFDLYRNYDGNGAVVGDTAVAASTSSVDDASVYAFASSSDASAVDVVAINKTGNKVPAKVSIASAPQLSTATLYDITDGSAAVVPVGTPPPVVTCAGGVCTLAYMMPPLSATTIVIR